MKELLDILRTAIELRQTSVAELSGRIDMDYRHLRRILSGQRPLTMDAFVRICDGLGLELKLGVGEKTC